MLTASYYQRVFLANSSSTFHGSFRCSAETSTQCDLIGDSKNDDISLA